MSVGCFVQEAGQGELFPAAPPELTEAEQLRAGVATLGQERDDLQARAAAPQLRAFPATGTPRTDPLRPTALRLILGARLRQLRESRGVSREDAGWKFVPQRRRSREWNSAGPP